MSRAAPSKPEPHPLFATLAIASMGLVVAGVLDFLGPLRALDAMLADQAPELGAERTVSPVWVWAWALGAAVGVASSVVQVRHTWQRVVIVLSSLVLTLGWFPVLVLLGYTPAIVVPLVALLWVSVGAIIYASRHSTPS